MKVRSEACDAPPATRIVPSGSSAALALLRATCIDGPADQVFDAGSYRSVVLLEARVDRPVKVGLPPMASTCPLDRRVAKPSARAVLMVPAELQLLDAGSYSSALA